MWMKWSEGGVKTSNNRPNDDNTLMMKWSRRQRMNGDTIGRKEQGTVTKKVRGDSK